MTHDARRALLLIAFCLLTSTATAYAECAWVLWYRHGPAPNTLEPWEVQVVFAARKECANELASRAARLNTRGWFATVEADTKLTAIRVSDTTEMVCLPDTVDPRGAKGSGG